MTIASISPTPRTQSSTQTCAPIPTSLLPAPVQGSIEGGLSALASLYEAMSKVSRTNAKTANQELNLNAAQQAAKHQERTDSIKKQMEAEASRGFFEILGDILGDLLTFNFSELANDLEEAWNSPNFWGDLLSFAKLFGQIASVVAVIATGGSALAIAGVALSTLSFLDNKFDLMTKLGIGKELSFVLRLGIGAGGGFVGAFGGQAVSAATKVIGATSGAVSSASTAKLGDFAAKGMERTADQKEALLSKKALEKVMEATIESLREDTQSQGRTNATIRQAMNTQEATLLLCVPKG